MPIDYLSGLTGHVRSAQKNLHLGMSLAFVAGAINAGGFLAVKMYTSHMTGIISLIADDLVLNEPTLAMAGLMALCSFIGGAACCAILINWARRKQLNSRYALPLLLEAALLLGFGTMGSRLDQWGHLFVPLTVMALCFLMGLQNAVITKISSAEIRTTHMTGIVTDLGIELGKMSYWNSSKMKAHLEPVVADKNRLRTQTSMVLMFFSGAVVGAYGFKQHGYTIATCLAVFLMVIALIPLINDLNSQRSPAK
jgi:uncharacterized membrane protein YoaK (UPF0700 family)